MFGGKCTTLHESLASQTELLGLVFRVKYNFSYINFCITTKRVPCQYQLLTPCDYVWCRGRMAKVQGSGCSDPRSILWSDFFKCNLINIY